MSHHWDPDRYLVYADERGRPFVDLLARVGADAPARVVDLGCGPGNLTALLARALAGRRGGGRRLLARRWWPGRSASPGVRFEQGDVRTWRPGAAGRRAVLQRDVPVGARPPRPPPGRWSGTSPPAAGSPSRCPATTTEPSHVLLHELAADPRFAGWTEGVARPHSHDPARVRRPAARPRAARWTPGRRPTCTCCPARTRCSPGSAAPVRDRRSRRCPRTCGRSSSRSTRRCCGRRTRPGRTAPRSRSAASSSSQAHPSPAQRDTRVPAAEVPGRRAAACSSGGLTTNAQRRAARRFYDRLGFTASHVGMKHYLGGER